MTDSFKLLDHVPLGIFVCSGSMVVRFWNTTMEDWTGINRSEILGHPLSDRFPRFGEDRFRARLELVAEGGPPAIFSYQLNGCLFPHRNSGKIERVQHATASFFRSDSGEGLIMTAVEDRSEVSKRIKSARAELQTRIETEATLRTAVAEKEFLMRELNHRVKNNLNMILSIINLQRETADGVSLRTALDDLDSRVRSFAVLQETMYQGGDPKAVRLDDYLSEIAEEVFASLRSPDSKAVLSVDMEPLARPFKEALYLGLIVSESITNSMKYGVGCAEGKRGSRIAVELRSGTGADGKATLRISDDGPGFPEGMNPLAGESLGLKLIKLLANEMEGNVAFGTGPGATIAVEFSSGSE